MCGEEVPQTVEEKKAFLLRNHIAVCRNNNSHITVLLIGVCHNLRHNASICLFLFMRMDDIAAAETGNVLAQILAKNQLELWILLVCLKERILASVFLGIIRRTRREVLDSYQFLVRPHKPFKQLDHI